MTAARIMVVDDDASLLGFTCKYLERLGYRAFPFGNSEKAWESFSAPDASYTVALIDLSMPGISGKHLCRKMLDVNPGIRLILTSGYPFDTESYLGAGPDRVAFLHKPFSPAKLTETVGRLVRNAESKTDAD